VRPAAGERRGNDCAAGEQGVRLLCEGSTFDGAAGGRSACNKILVAAKHFEENAMSDVSVWRLPTSSDLVRRLTNLVIDFGNRLRDVVRAVAASIGGGAPSARRPK
jgi:hypothetical protein